MPILNRQKKSLIFGSRIAFVIFVIILIVIARSTWNIRHKEKETAANLSEAQIELMELKDRERQLQSELQRLSTERGIEEEIREKFSVARAGEQAIIIVDGEEPQTIEEKQEEKKSLMRRVLDLF